MATDSTQVEQTQEWLVIIQDLPDSAEKRKIFGKAHVAEMEPDRGSVWLLGGMMLEGHNLASASKKVTGNVIIAQATSEQDLVQMLMKDVYASEGIWNMEQIQIIPFKSLFRKGLGM